MILSAIVLSLQIFTLPMVPEALEAPEDRAIYLAEHYWDNTPLSEELIANNPTEYEQFLSDFLSILPFLDKEKQADVLFPILAYSTNLVRRYLCSKESPVYNPEIYQNCIKSVAKKSEKFVIDFYYLENCDVCIQNMDRLDQSKIIGQSIAKNQVSIHLITTTETPQIQLKNKSGEILIKDITIEETEWILGQKES